MKKYFIVIILTIAHITTNCSNEKEWVQWTEKGFDWKSPSSIFSESFYTRTAVTQCAESLKDAIKGKNNPALSLRGHSTGAGIIATTLEKLMHYNKDYFKSTNISQLDAAAILKAVNNGCIIYDRPLLKLQNTTPVTALSTLIRGALFCTAGYYASPYCEKIIDAERAPYATLVLGTALYSFLNKKTNAICCNAMVKYLFPLLTLGHFDPYHKDPLQALYDTLGKTSCPILLHLNTNDWAIDHCNEITAKAYHHIQFKNAENAYLFISTQGGHHGVSPEYREVRDAFDKKYGLTHNQENIGSQESNDPLYGLNNIESKEAKKRIIPQGFLANLQRNKWLLVPFLMSLKLLFNSYYHH